MRPDRMALVFLFALASGRWAWADHTYAVVSAQPRILLFLPCLLLVMGTAAAIEARMWQALASEKRRVLSTTLKANGASWLTGVVVLAPTDFYFWVPGLEHSEVATFRWVVQWSAAMLCVKLLVLLAASPRDQGRGPALLVMAACSLVAQCVSAGLLVASSSIAVPVCN